MPGVRRFFIASNNNVMIEPYLKLIVAPMHQPNGFIIRLLEGRKPMGAGFMSYQKAKVPIDFFDKELLEKDQVAEEWFRKVPYAEIENIYRQLEGARIAVLPLEELVAQGIKYSLTIGNGTNALIYKWRSKLPKEWEPIGGVINILLRMADEQEIIIGDATPNRSLEMTAR